MTQPPTAILPRYWKREISALTGLRFCDRFCDCGENNRLWWFPASPESCRKWCPSWVPAWMNGGDTHEIWRWLVENGKVGK